VSVSGSTPGTNAKPLCGFRKMFATRFAPSASLEQLDAFDRMQQRANTPEMAVRTLFSLPTLGRTGLPGGSISGDRSMRSPAVTRSRPRPPKGGEAGEGGT
jgi:hypothetical protein